MNEIIVEGKCKKKFFFLLFLPNKFITKIKLNFLKNKFFTKIITTQNKIDNIKKMKKRKNLFN